MALTDKLSAIGNAIREKTGGTDLLTLDQMPTEISNIQGGGTVEELTITSNGTYNPPTGIDGYAPVVVNVPQDSGLPAEAFNITGDCEYMFSHDKWNWFLEKYGNQITMNNITSANYCFQDCYNLTNLPISSINFKVDCPEAQYLFSNCQNITEFPRITFTEASLGSSFRDMFNSCYRLRELPYDYFTSMSDDWDTINSNGIGDRQHLFTGCFSLREHPDLKCLGRMRNGEQESLYQLIFNGCYTLNKAILPVSLGQMRRNSFEMTFDLCSMLKDFTFITNEDGTPITTGWKSQTIDLTGYVGYASSVSDITGYNSGITADKEVKDDATYQALKDDPDWFSCDINYSRYNHNSAVRTINSLPDTSAYLTANGGTNTIKFKGQSGASTDGGAINTLTEEEIAVATAKGWTVSLV